MSTNGTGITADNNADTSGFDKPSEATYNAGNGNRKLSASPGTVSRAKRTDNAELQPKSSAK